MRTLSWTSPPPETPDRGPVETKTASGRRAGAVVACQTLRVTVTVTEGPRSSGRPRDDFIFSTYGTFSLSVKVPLHW